MYMNNASLVGTVSFLPIIKGEGRVQWLTFGIRIYNKWENKPAFISIDVHDEKHKAIIRKAQKSDGVALTGKLMLGKSEFKDGTPFTRYHLSIGQEDQLSLCPGNTSLYMNSVFIVGLLYNRAIYRDNNGYPVFKSTLKTNPAFSEVNKLDIRCIALRDMVKPAAAKLLRQEEGRTCFGVAIQGALGYRDVTITGASGQSLSFKEHHIIIEKFSKSIPKNPDKAKQDRLKTKWGGKTRAS